MVAPSICFAAASWSPQYFVKWLDSAHTLGLFKLDTVVVLVAGAMLRLTCDERTKPSHAQPNEYSALKQRTFKSSGCNRLNGNRPGSPCRVYRRWRPYCRLRLEGPARPSGSGVRITPRTAVTAVAEQPFVKASYVVIATTHNSTT